MIKIAKHKQKIQRKMTSVVKFGAAFERLTFFILSLLLVCHLIGCLWIYLAKASQDDSVKGDSWIEANDYESMDVWELYATSVYFTMQTLTTVGYGDISLASTTERVICIFLQFVGVIFFSFASGSLTTIIANYDQTNAKNQEKLNILNRILKEYHIPPELYAQLMTQIQNFDDKKTLHETKNFLDSLPFRLKIKTIMHLYKDSYESIHYLQLQSDSFIGWICPLLKQVYIPIEQYIYYETDQITEIYFLTKGNAGFVLPFKQNIVYIEIEKGDHFGEIDFVVASGSKMLSVEEMVELINTVNFNLIRQFTVQAIQDSTLLTLSIKNLQRMQKQFNAQFKKLFNRATPGLKKALDLKIKAINKVHDASMIQFERQYRKKKLASYKPVENAVPDETLLTIEQSESLNLKFFKGAKRLRDIMSVKKKKDKDSGDDAGSQEGSGEEYDSEESSSEMSNSSDYSNSSNEEGKSKKKGSNDEHSLSDSDSQEGDKASKSMASAGMSKVEESMKNEMAKQTQLQIQQVINMSMKKGAIKSKLGGLLANKMKTSKETKDKNDIDQELSIKKNKTAVGAPDKNKINGDPNIRFDSQSSYDIKSSKDSISDNDQDLDQVFSGRKNSNDNRKQEASEIKDQQKSNNKNLNGQNSIDMLSHNLDDDSKIESISIQPGDDEENDDSQTKSELEDDIAELNNKINMIDENQKKQQESINLILNKFDQLITVSKEKKAE